jgi:curved DNA-binding protein CbpA
LALGLAARADLTDDDVRAAWRRLATATHPDRADGGDPARFAAAAAAYTVLRTRSGRGEALADLAEGGRPPSRRGRGGGDAGRPARQAPTGSYSPTRQHAARQHGLAGARLAQRVRGGRPGRLLLRVLIAVAVGAGVAAVTGLQPATPALWIGAATWLLLTARQDLAPPT